MHMQDNLELSELQEFLEIISYNSFILKRTNQRSNEPRWFIQGPTQLAGGRARSEPKALEA